MHSIVSGKGHRSIGNRKGQATLEFALVAILLLGLLFLIMDSGVMFFVNLTMQYAVRDGARYAITGRTAAGQPNQRAAVIQQIRTKSIGIYDRYCTNPPPKFYVVNPTTNPPTQTQLSDDPGNPQSQSVGSPNDIIIIRVDCSWPLLTPFLKAAFPNGIYSFNVKATMKNEPPAPPGG
ncbi:MAG TPA: TadE/TadG family type IV pilus assembly protein [Thermodesulfovibrionales bacterium]|nr:TadE/TadG family type IV pilus assembly protein [Thermodesulfovibrionales bacterium]